VASFDRAIPPGGVGKITLTVRTKGYKGDHDWGAKIITNDPRMNEVLLSVKAFVQVPIRVKPSYVHLYGKEDVTVTRSVEIEAGLDKPLTLKPGQFNLAEKVIYAIEEIDAGRRFKISFASIKGVSGSYRGFLKLETNYEEKPMVTIPISARFVKEKTSQP
jgi:hypothetical protein